MMKGKRRKKKAVRQSAVHRTGKLQVEPSQLPVG
jgi:hypothetical protein